MRVERGAGLDAGGQVGIGEEAGAEGHGVELAGRDGGGGFLGLVAHVGDEHALVGGADRRQDVAGLLPEKVAAHDVQVGQAASIELAGEPGGQADGIAVAHVVVAVQRRDAQADAVRCPRPRIRRR